MSLINVRLERPSFKGAVVSIISHIEGGKEGRRFQTVEARLGRTYTIKLPFELSASGRELSVTVTEANLYGGIVQLAHDGIDADPIELAPGKQVRLRTEDLFTAAPAQASMDSIGVDGASTDTGENRVQNTGTVEEREYTNKDEEKNPVGVTGRNEEPAEEERHDVGTAQTVDTEDTGKGANHKSSLEEDSEDEVTKEDYEKVLDELYAAQVGKIYQDRLDGEASTKVNRISELLDYFEDQENEEKQNLIKEAESRA